MEDEKFELPIPEERPSKEQVDWSALFDAMAGMVEVEKVVDVLDVRARALAEPEEDVDTGAGDVYTSFSLGPERYALSAAATREVIEMPDVTPVPKAPAAVGGLFHRRGAVCVALNTKNLLGLTEDGNYGNAVLLSGDPAGVALLVDDVHAAATIPPALINPGDVGGRAVAGITPDRHIVLDAGALWKEIRAVLETEPRGF